MNKINPPPKFQFSITRMLLATAAVALVFGIFKFLFTFKESAVIIPATLVAAALGGLVLIQGKKEPKFVLFYVIAVLLLVIVLFLAVGIRYWFFSRM